MATTTFSGPIRAGTVKDNAGANVGNVVLAQSNTVARTDTTAKDLFILPAGSEIVDISVTVPTASDAGTSADVTVAIKGGSALTGATSVTSTGRPAVTPANVASWLDVGTSDATITGVYAEAGTASTTGGPFTVTVRYVQK